MKSSAAKRMILKFEATGCLDNWPRSGRRSTNAHGAQTVQEEMVIVAGGEVIAEEGTSHWLPCTTVRVALRRILLYY